MCTRLSTEMKVFRSHFQEEKKKIFFTFKDIRNGTSVISSMASGKMLDACSSQVANILSTALNCILSSSFFKDVLQNIIRVEI